MLFLDCRHLNIIPIWIFKLLAEAVHFFKICPGGFCRVRGWRQFYYLEPIRTRTANIFLQPFEDAPLKKALRMLFLKSESFLYISHGLNIVPHLTMGACPEYPRIG